MNIYTHKHSFTDLCIAKYSILCIDLTDHHQLFLLENCYVICITILVKAETSVYFF